jgi:transcriptional regulator with XRE-family HTH domain
MAAQSNHTKRDCQNDYVSASSRAQRDAGTFLAQLAAYVEAIDVMAGTDQQQQQPPEPSEPLDTARGNRIKARREELHLTQPAVVDLIAKAAAQLPAEHDLHPENAHKAPVTLRGYQTYERGGGIVWEKAKLLADVLQIDVQALMNGAGSDRGPAPDPFAGHANGVAGELAEIRAEIQNLRRERSAEADDVRALLRTQNQILEHLLDAVEREKQARAETEEARRLLLESAAAATRAYEDAAQRLAAEPGKRAT